MNRFSLLLVVLVTCIARVALSQCTWQTGLVVWGLNGDVRAMVTMPNGDLIVGGDFTTDGAGHSVSYVARFDGAMWAPIGSGTPGPVRSLVVMPNGDLIAGGLGLWRWTGAAWVPLSNFAFSGFVQAMAATPSGDLIIGGSFMAASLGQQQLALHKIAKWNGSTWSALGSGLSSSVPVTVSDTSSVQALAVLPNGDVVAGGSFSFAGGVSSPRLARWNGQSWAPIPGGIPNNAVTSLIALPNGDLVAGGGFAFIGATSIKRIALWNATTSAWSRFALGLDDGVVSSITQMSNGDLVVGGTFSTSAGVSTPRLARWDGSAWRPVASTLHGSVYAVRARSNGEVLAGGTFRFTDGSPGDRIARWGCYCVADLDDDGEFFNRRARDGAVTIDDLIYVLRAFELGDASVDLDNDGDPAVGIPDGAVTIEDLLYFLEHFEMGC